MSVYIHLSVAFSTLQGIWMGMLTGTFLQMSILLSIIFTTKWDKQVRTALKNIFLENPAQWIPTW
jgi:hypothetical protein